jgi:hypothetical protein
MDNRENHIVRIAKAMRDAYGEHQNIPWEQSETQEEWMVCAYAAVKEMQKFQHQSIRQLTQRDGTALDIHGAIISKNMRITYFYEDEWRPGRALAFFHHPENNIGVETRWFVEVQDWQNSSVVIVPAHQVTI